MNEKLLEAWLRLSTILSNDRIVSEMPYNEALICNISLNPKSDSFYIQHRKSLQLINALATKAGPEKSQEAIDLFTYIADMAEEIIESKDRKDE